MHYYGRFQESALALPHPLYPSIGHADRSYSRRLIVSSRWRVPGEPISTTSSGAPSYVHRRDHLRRPLVRHVQQVGLDDVEVREDDVERRVEERPIGCSSSQVPIRRYRLPEIV